MNALPVPASSQWTARRTCISGTNLIARPQRGAAARQSPPRLCRAAAEKEGTKQDSKLQVPDAAPAGSKPSVSQEQIPTDDSASSGSFSDEQRLTADEIGAQIGQLRAANKENEKKEGMLDVRWKIRSDCLHYITYFYVFLCLSLPFKAQSITSHLHLFIVLFLLFSCRVFWSR